MGKQYTVEVLAGSVHTNNVYIGGKYINNTECGVSSVYYMVRSNNSEYIFHAQWSEQLHDNECAFSTTHRNLLKVSLGDTVLLQPVENYTYKHITSLSMEIKPLSKDETLEISLSKFGRLFKNKFNGLIISENFNIIVEIKGIYFICELTNFKFNKNLISQHGVFANNTYITYIENPRIKFRHAEKRAPVFKNIINLQQMGIGGLSNEFSIIFRRLFASRLVSPGTLNDMNIHHIRGMLIHGPPGCGKTLLARQIGKLLNCRDIKVVNGPELLNMYVGESEANARKLFENAVNDKECNELHLIICDEFDALCRPRGTTTHTSPVLDNVVNTLLSYLDGINQLNNILMICMTNRFDLIDQAMLRPGRLELQIEIGLPNVEGRLEIFGIHTSPMKKNGYLDNNVDLKLLANKTQNFTGAEIEGLVKSASSYAITRTINDKLQSTTKPLIVMDDFVKAFEDIKPMFGDISPEIIKMCEKPLICWSNDIKSILDHIKTHIDNMSNGNSLSIVMDGLPYTGKTFISAHIIKQLNPNFARIINPISLISKSDIEKSHIIHQIFNNSDKSEFSIIIVDMFERLIDWCPIGNLLNNQILQTILTLLRKSIPANRKSIVIVTCYDYNLLKKLEIDNLFDIHVTLPHIVEPSAAKLFNYQTDQNTELSTILHNLEQYK